MGTQTEIKEMLFKHQKNLFLLWGWLNTVAVLPREAVESIFSEIIKTQLGTARGSLL